MRKINTLLVLLVLVISACKKDEKIVDQTTLFSRSNSRLSSSRPLHPGDPNLDASWDWTQHSWTAYFNNANGSVGSVTTLNPFIDGAQLVYGNVDVSKADMYPASGWMLVSRDFGTPTEANAYPFLLLYNKYRGILRVCVLRTYDVLSSYQQITLGYATNTTYPKFFKYSSTKPPYSGADGPNDNTQSAGYKQTAITSAGVQQWMIADFDVTGYSETFDVNTSFNISVSEVSLSDVALNGNIQLDGTAQPQAGGGPNAEGLIKNAETFYAKTAQGVSNVLKISPDDVIGKMAGGPVLFVKTFFNLLAGFSGGSSGVPYSIKLKGTTNQTGSIKLTSPKTSFSVYLKPLTGVIGYRALQNIPWGIFNLEGTSAQVTYQTVYTTVTDEYGYPGDVWDGDFRWVIFQPNYFNNDLTINPALISEVKSIEVLYGDNNIPYGFIPISKFDETQRMIAPPKNVFELQLGIKIEFNNGSVVYKLISY
ncbi:hypothetical protein [Pedobacter sp. KACC 23697]|uniref:Uncharacterized protein n=1 Tax=Pedobacter sp. KACC 23697 TaxID=3149230 RepID=A0AAU7K4P0_9SPHI